MVGLRIMAYSLLNLFARFSNATISIRTTNLIPNSHHYLYRKSLFFSGSKFFIPVSSDEKKYTHEILQNL